MLREDGAHTPTALVPTPLTHTPSMMSASPLSSPRRMPRLQPVSPLVPQTREADTAADNTTYVARTSSAAPLPSKDHDGRGDDRGAFYHIALTDDPTQPDQTASRPLNASHHARSQSYAASYSTDYDRGDNYGYRPSYYDGVSRSSDTTRTAAGLVPVQEYHNAFTGADAVRGASTASATPPLPSSATASSASSKFATFSSASRAFLEHRRQQSIPNLLPSFASIGKNLGRAISPDRSLRSPEPSRPPIPVYKNDQAGRSRDRASDDEYSDDGDDDDYDSESESDDDHHRSGAMSPFTGDNRTTKHSSTYASYDRHKHQSDTPSVGNGFSSWLSGGGTKATSPDRASLTMSPHNTTPEPFHVASRGGAGAVSSGSPTFRRRMSFASDASATPRSSIAASTTASPSRFSQLATSMTATLSRLTQNPSPSSPRTVTSGFEQDELYNLNIDAALFPSSHPSDRDAFSPAAYKNLEANAIGTLRRMQAAYRQRAVALRDMTSEKSARDEELEEAETRAQHLKMQLEGMARQAADQQKEMQLLMDELAAEKKARAQERAMLLSGVPTTPTSTSMSIGGMRDRDDDQAASTIVSEDLGVDDAQRDHKRRNAWRRSLKSDGSSYDDTDDGEEGSAMDEDESNSSVFSRSRSPTFTPSINVSLDGSAVAGERESQVQVPHPRVAALGSMRQSRTVSSASTASSATVLSQQQPVSAFQKLMRNVTATIKDEEPELGNGTSSCRNCRGQGVSFAWNMVSNLRDENKYLKQRVGQLEVVVDGALDMVNGVGLD